MAELRLYPLWVEACFAALACEAGAEGVEWLPLASVFANLGDARVLPGLVDEAGEVVAGDASALGGR